MARIPTVKIVDDNPRGWKIINESAFIKGEMKIYKEEPKSAQVQQSEELTLSKLGQMNKADLTDLCESSGLDTEGLNKSELYDLARENLFEE